MPNRKICYIYSNSKENLVVNHGIEFRDFINSLETPVKNLLLIKHDFFGGCYHGPSGFKFVKEHQLWELSADNIYNYGDFCWFDFNDEYALDLLSPREIAELLYFGHKGRPLESYVNTTLKNRFAYWTHDDGWYNKVYLSDPDDFLPVLSHAVGSVVSGEDDRADLLPKETARTLLSLSHDGLLIDYEHITVTKSGTELPFYIIGKVTDYDDLLNNLQKYKEKALKKGIVRFNRKFFSPPVKKQGLKARKPFAFLGRGRKKYN
ncbi:hypothetical protein SAMN02745823_01470 [Sporobacter termitidis DSM 10068]|uniref:Uncharacterized protein n=1 Tax=Sporobacter termitidis DSM 10068 TaxID=1123282 RepID=A0A1M5WYM2_9FIRM|nr:hypothetical protein [Sporobacter termitidis]SHH92657.1 hypothetical protein SAMN02745823_01470 [Sporobacter termitidis DSM 10068]